jgi:hypothetical protein
MIKAESCHVPVLRIGSTANSWFFLCHLIETSNGETDLAHFATLVAAAKWVHSYFYFKYIHKRKCGDSDAWNYFVPSEKKNRIWFW